MPARIYNNFTSGIWQDDFLTWWPKLIEWNNVTGLNTWYWLTLWLKSNKLFTTNGAMRGLYIRPRTRIPDNNNNLAFWDNWEIYDFNSTDNIPTYTVTTWWQVRGFVIVGADRLFLYENSPWSSTVNLAYNWSLSNWNTVDESYDLDFISQSDMVPILLTDWFAYFWWSRMVRLNDEPDPIASKQSFSILNWSCQWITKLGNQFYLYTNNKDVTIWNWVSTSNLWSNKLNFPPRRVHQVSATTYMTGRDWELRIWNGYQFQKIVKPVKSERLDDNSWFKDKFNFSWGTEVRWQYITNVWDSIYIWCNDGVPWIYVYDNILEWTFKGLHKSITTIHDWTAIDEVYAIDYDHTQDRVFYSYKAWTTYWVDYIDVNSKETQKLWYWVTEVFSANTTFIKRPKQLRVTTSNTSWNNYVKVYERVNNWPWNLLRTINEDTDEISRKEIKNYTKENIDVQFKVELYNDSQWEKWPIVHEIYFDYIVTEK